MREGVVNSNEQKDREKEEIHSIKIREKGSRCNNQFQKKQNSIEKFIAKKGKRRGKSFQRSKIKTVHQKENEYQISGENINSREREQ